jgi:rod shape-determining protein MreD
MLICVVFFGLFLGPSAGLESGVAAGLLNDMFALDFFGINALTYGLSGLVAGLLSTKVFKESKKTEFAIVFFFTVFSMSLHFMLVLVLSKALSLTFFEYFWSSILPTGLYTGLVAVPIFVKFIDMYDFRELQGLL